MAAVGRGVSFAEPGLSHRFFLSGLRCSWGGLALLDSLLPDLLCQLQHRWALPAALPRPGLEAEEKPDGGQGR